MKFIKTFEEYQPLLSPEIAGLEPATFNRKKPDLELKNRRNSDETWLQNHPLIGVKIYGHEAIPKNTKWHMNDDGSYNYSVDFGNGENYISVYTENISPKKMMSTIRLGSSIEGKEELLAWLHTNMVYHAIPTLLIEKILKMFNTEIKEKGDNHFQ